MIKKRSNGFTLVELLAVIVILAVIILIAVTAVIPRMNKAKKKAFIDEVLMYLKAGHEIYVENGDTQSCFDLNDFDDYIKQSKENYTGTLFVSENKISINITNGKYYLKTTNLNDIDVDDLLDEEPADYISSCSDTSLTYSITYNLNGGTLSASNPSTYNVNTPTFRLNNPTKSGYRFAGWSGGKNLFNIYDTPYKTGKYVRGNGTITNEARYAIYKANIKPNTTYRILNSGMSNAPGYAIYDSSDTRLTGANYNNNDVLTFTTPENSAYILFSLVTQEGNVRYEKDFYVLEEGTGFTEYETDIYLNNNVSIPRGSSGNRTYDAIWEEL